MDERKKKRVQDFLYINVLWLCCAQKRIS